MQVKVNQSFNRLDKFLFQYFESIPLSLIQRLIRQYKIKINNKKSKANSDLKKGDIIFTGTPEGVGALESGDQIEMGFNNYPPKKLIVI